MLNEPVLVDTGPLLAIYNQDDEHHTICREQLPLLAVGKAYTCWPVVTEVVYMLRKRKKQRDNFIQSLIDGELALLRLRDQDLILVHEIFLK